MFECIIILFILLYVFVSYTRCTAILYEMLNLRMADSYCSNLKSLIWFFIVFNTMYAMVLYLKSCKSKIVFFLSNILLFS